MPVLTLLCAALTWGSTAERASAVDGQDVALRGCVDALERHAVHGLGAELLSRAPQSFLLSGDIRVQPVRFEHADCRAFIAVGAKHTQDIELRVQSPEGRTLAVSQGPSTTPYVFHCGHSGETAMVSLRMLDGQGEVAVLGFSQLLLDAHSLGAVERCAGVGIPRPPPVELGREPRARSIADELVQVGRELSTLGYGPARLLARGNLGSDQHEAHVLGLEAGPCYALLAAGDADVLDLDLRVLPIRRSTQPMASDSTRRRTGFVKLCPDPAMRYLFDVAVFQGEGAYEVYAFALGESAPLPAEISGESRIAYTEALMRMQARQLAVRSTSSGMLRPDESLTMPVTLHGGRCYAFAAVGAHGEAAGKLALTILDSEHRVLAADSRSQRDPLVFTCPSDDQDARAVIRAKDAREPLRFLLLAGDDAPVASAPTTEAPR